MCWHAQENIKNTEFVFLHFPFMCQNIVIVDKNQWMLNGDKSKKTTTDNYSDF